MSIKIEFTHGEKVSRKLSTPHLLDGVYDYTEEHEFENDSYILMFVKDVDREGAFSGTVWVKETPFVYKFESSGKPRAADRTLYAITLDVDNLYASGSTPTAAGKPRPRQPRIEKTNGPKSPPQPGAPGFSILERPPAGLVGRWRAPEVQEVIEIGEHFVADVKRCAKLKAIPVFAGVPFLARGGGYSWDRVPFGILKEWTADRGLFAQEVLEYEGYTEREVAVAMDYIKRIPLQDGTVTVKTLVNFREFIRCLVRLEKPQPFAAFTSFVFDYVMEDGTKQQHAVVGGERHPVGTGIMTVNGTPYTVKYIDPRPGYGSRYPAYVIMSAAAYDAYVDCRSAGIDIGGRVIVYPRAYLGRILLHKVYADNNDGVIVVFAPFMADVELWEQYALFSDPLSDACTILSHIRRTATGAGIVECKVLLPVAPSMSSLRTLGRVGITPSGLGEAQVAKSKRARAILVSQILLALLCRGTYPACFDTLVDRNPDMTQRRLLTDAGHELDPSEVRYLIDAIV